MAYRINPACHTSHTRTPAHDHKVYPVALDRSRHVYRMTYVGGPDSGLKSRQVWESYSRETFTTPDGRRASVWKFARIDDDGTPWEAIYLPGGQRRGGFGSRYAAQIAAADGSLLAEFAAEDAAVMAKPCPGGCGRPAAAIVNTAKGPQPVCAVHRAVVAKQFGLTVREPANPQVTA